MFISYLTAPKAVTSHQGWCQLSTKWWWSPLRRLPNIQPYYWVPISPLTNDVHVENLDINFDQSGKSDFFLKKPSRFHWRLAHPGVGFSVFSSRENVDTVQCLCAVTGTQSRMPCVSASQKLHEDENSFRFVVFVFLFFPCVFYWFGCFVWCESSVVFFCLLLFVVILAVFVRPLWSFWCCNHAVVLALADSKYNILALAFAPVYFLSYTIFLRHLTCLLVLLFCCCVSCCVVSVVLLGFPPIFYGYFGVLSLTIYQCDVAYFLLCC